jgi:hypothetical protein
VFAWFTYWDPGEYGIVDGAWRPRPVWHALRDGTHRYRT